MKALKLILIVIGSVFTICLISLAYIGAASPETFVYRADEIPAKYRNELAELNLLNDSEELLYMYSDALFKLKNGVYILTDEHLILYSDEWDEPETIISFDEITFLDIAYDDSFLDDSYITLETVYGVQAVFPVSSEKGRDKKFYRYLEDQVQSVN